MVVVRERLIPENERRGEPVVKPPKTSMRTSGVDEVDVAEGGW